MAIRARFFSVVDCLCALLEFVDSVLTFCNRSLSEPGVSHHAARDKTKGSGTNGTSYAASRSRAMT